jgi:hypothetical protein
MKVVSANLQVTITSDPNPYINKVKNALEKLALILAQYEE